MTHPSSELLAAFRAGRASAETVLEVGDHLAACAECRNAAAQPRSGSGALEAFFGPHLSYADLEALVDRTGAAAPDDADLHLARCVMCAGELADLRAFRTRSTRRNWIWAAAAAAAAIAIVSAAVLRDPPGANRSPAPAAIQRTATAPPAAPRFDPGVRVDAPPAPAVLQADAALLPLLAELRAGRVPSPPFAGALHDSAGQDRAGTPAEAQPELLAPIGVVIEEATPRFRWRAAGDPLAVEVFDPSFHLVASSDATPAGAWRPSSPLPRGVLLTWQLVRGGSEREVFPAPPRPPARFYVVSAPAARAIAEARRERRKLDLALLFVREGMSREAAAAFRELAHEHPRNDELQKIAGLLSEPRRTR